MYAQLVKTFPIYSGARNLIAVFSRSRNRSLSGARIFQSKQSNPISLRCILILFSPLRLGLLRNIIFRLMIQILHRFLISRMSDTWPNHIIQHDLIIQKHLVQRRNYGAPHYTVPFRVLSHNRSNVRIFSKPTFSQTFLTCASS